ncbi:MAG TPA: amino acid permease, partial [Candidatus Hydrogenedentes bacterium]|nr:amino acid permease [Candidatus Hydrogenedentota bacterium]
MHEHLRRFARKLLKAGTGGDRVRLAQTQQHLAVSQGTLHRQGGNSTLGLDRGNTVTTLTEFQDVIAQTHADNQHRAGRVQIRGIEQAPGFLAGLLQAAWTFTGYDASAHASEETKDAARNAPKGILMAIIASAIAGYAMLIFITLAIQDLPAT